MIIPKSVSKGNERAYVFEVSDDEFDENYKVEE